jgi:hypothetical protein
MLPSAGSLRKEETEFVLIYKVGLKGFRSSFSC